MSDQGLSQNMALLNKHSWYTYIVCHMIIVTNIGNK
jgi:hypothetical protein